MNRKYQRTGYVGMLCVLMIAPALAQVQQRNNDEQRPDPRQQVNDRLREMLAVTADDEWAVLQPRLERVLALSSRLGGNTGAITASMGRRLRNFRFEVDSPAIDQYQRFRQELNRMLANPNASAVDIRTLIRSLRDAKAQAEAELDAAQAELIPYLTSRQEALLIQMGALD
jgi:hypothetical protein